MKYPTALCTIWFWYIFCLLIPWFFIVIVACDPPRIRPNVEEITLIVRETRIIQCIHSEEIPDWLVPFYVDPSIYNISEAKRDTSNNYIRNLSLIYESPESPAQTLVGSYYCLGQSQLNGDMSRETLNSLYLQRKASRLFVFMKDTEVKLAGKFYGSNRFYASMNSTVYFPCWPTEHSVQMQIVNDWVPNGIAYEYDLHLGPKVYVKNENEFTNYECKAGSDTIGLVIEYIKPTEYVVIDTFQYGYAKVSGELRLKCRTDNYDEVIFKWTCPSGVICDSTSDSLFLANLTKADEGMYTCTATNPKLPVIEGSKSEERFVKIIDQLEIIDFQPFQSVEYSFDVNEDLQINVRFTTEVPLSTSFTYPIYIKQNRIAKTKSPDNILSLIITNMLISESGTYSLIIKNGSHTEKMSFKVSITGPPIFSDDATMLDKIILPPDVNNATVQFHVTGFPTAQVTCFFYKCNLFYSCKRDQIEIKNDHISVNQLTAFNATYILNFRYPMSGHLACFAKNLIDSNTLFVPMLVMEKMEHFLIEPSADGFVAGMNASLTCFASKYNYRNTIFWEYDLTRLENQTGVKVYNEELEFMYKSTVEFTKVDTSHEGSYQCKCRSLLKNGESEDAYEYELILKEFIPISLNIFSNGLVFGQWSLMLTCNVKGMPTPTLTWFKDDQPLKITDRIEITENLLHISVPTLDDIGVYECRAVNFFEQISKRVDYHTDDTITPARHISIAYTITFSVLLTLLLSFLGMWLIIYRQDRNKKLELKKQFLVGNSKQMNPNLSLTDQADVLPYDMDYDFCADQLELGIMLGVGAFGIVLKAEATGIVRSEEKTTVAVKRVQEPLKDEHLKALIGEMKIMIHIGRHKNVVSLLGVVHENLINKGELLVITEFCGLGNLREFVLKNRAFFVDERDSHKNQIYNNNFVENHVNTITTTDLVCWSYQVSQGMQYLARKGVLHGDLAARNILLTTDSVVKICDFGLSRKMRPEENYEKESSTPLPLRWLAIESMDSKVFNTSSDVWSFGVMMWELFSLSGIPYVEIKNEDLLSWLKNGHRLDIPLYASSAIYAIMLECWRSVPEERPRFNELGQSLSEHLSKDLVQIFEDKDATYVAITNEENVERRYTPMIAMPNRAATTAVDLNSHSLDEQSAETIPLRRKHLEL